MGKSSKKMFSNLYENDVLDLDTIDDLENVAPIKSNKAIKRATKQKNRKEETIKLSGGGKPPISTKPVEATCNKCKNRIIGTLLADIYIAATDKMVPFISYHCDSCNHEGKRSVMSLALPLDQYERRYFN